MGSSDINQRREAIHTSVQGRMEVVIDWVQTKPRLLKLVSTVTNSVDPRNWALTIALFLLDLAVNISSIYSAWDTDKPAVGLMLASIFLMSLEIPFIFFYFKYALDQRNLLRNVLMENDNDKDGLLTREEAEKMLMQLPKGTMSLEFSQSLEKYSVDHMLWCHHQPRIVTFRTLEFLVSWLMFFASLMLIKPGEKITALVAIQGVVSVIGIMLVLNDVYDNYFRKYRSKIMVIKYSCVLWYAITLLTTFAVLLAGYGFASLIYAGRYGWPDVYVNTTAVPQDDLVGFVTGWLLSAFIVAAFLQLAVLNACCTRLGYMQIHISHAGEDDPVRLLGKRVSIFKSKEAPFDATADLLSGQKPEPKTSFLPPPAPLPPPPPAIKPESTNIILT